LNLQRQSYFSVSSEGVPIRCGGEIIADYSPFGVLPIAIGMDGRKITMDSYRFGFQSQEKDDEVKGGGNSYDFGARMYDARIGRFLSLDAYASKFASQSPYVFAGNTPIMALDSNGDSVLFYSQSGVYLGFSHDNQRYKGKNLLVIIDDKAVNNFNKWYNLKRKINSYSSPEAREANVAGLEAMGTTYVVNEILTFYNRYYDKNMVNGKEVVEKDDYKQVEWGVHFKRVSNPLNPKLKNWLTIDYSTVETDGLKSAIDWNSVGKEGELHIHPEHCDSQPSVDDFARQRKYINNVSQNEVNPKANSLVVDGIGIYFYNRIGEGEDRKTGMNEKIITKNSFKNAH